MDQDKEMPADHHRLSTVESSFYNKQTDYRDLFSTRKHPLVVKGLVEKWPCGKWTIEELGAVLQQPTKFRLYAIIYPEDNHLVDVPVVAMETDCFYVDATISEFHEWLNREHNQLPDCNPFHPFERSRYWGYADYKYMNQLFADRPEHLLDVRWDELGFKGRNGSQSTIWIGSNYANTPCHMDTYGFNLVAQIQGKKRWTLYNKKQEACLKPTRIPYEESSIFCNNVGNNDAKGLQVAHNLAAVVKVGFQLLNIWQERSKCLQRQIVTLCPGDMLFVPKHWWHFVECLEPSISINIWVEKETDDFDRLKEAIARLLMCSLKQLDSDPEWKWLNPTEENYGFENNCQIVKDALNECLCDQKDDKKRTDKEVSQTMSFNDILDCVVSDSVLTKIADDVIQKSKAR